MAKKNCNCDKKIETGNESSDNNVMVLFVTIFIIFLFCLGLAFMASPIIEKGNRYAEYFELKSENIRLNNEFLRQEIELEALKEELNAVATEDCKLYQENGVVPLHCEEFLNTKEGI